MVSRPILNFINFYPSPRLIICLLGIILLISPRMTEQVEPLLLSEAESCRIFSSKLYKAISGEPKENVIFSPLGIHVLLSYLSHGARGKTADEMITNLDITDVNRLHTDYKSLILSLNSVDQAKLHLANAIFLHSNTELLAEFATLGKHYYDLEAVNIDFTDSIESANKINNWVSENTNNKIRNVIESADITDDTKVILVNAVYLKNSWLYPFDIQHTDDRTFHVNKNVQQQIPMMQNKQRYAHGELQQFNSKFLEIPYTDEDLSMVIILPNEIDGLTFLEKNFDWDIIRNAQRATRETILQMPKFKIECTHNLKEILTKIGFVSMFDRVADFSGMTQSALKISRVFQKAFIEIDEKGSEAAAASTVQLRLKRMLTEPNEFIVNRPFMFVIHHKPSQIPLFIGSISRIDSEKTKPGHSSIEKDEF